MRCLLALTVLVTVIGLSQLPAEAQDRDDQLHNYFAGRMIQFGSGAGVSSNRPRIDLIIHYCASGAYFTTGQSCRPNLIARGYQCSPVQDAGRWQIGAEGGQAVLQWMSNTGTPGQIPLHLHTNGIVADAQGNPFSRIGRAECQ